MAQTTKNALQETEDLVEDMGRERAAKTAPASSRVPTYKAPAKPPEAPAPAPAASRPEPVVVTPRGLPPAPDLALPPQVPVTPAPRGVEAHATKERLAMAIDPEQLAELAPFYNNFTDNEYRKLVGLFSPSMMNREHRGGPRPTLLGSSGSGRGARATIALDPLEKEYLDASVDLAQTGLAPPGFVAATLRIRECIQREMVKNQWVVEEWRRLREENKKSVAAAKRAADAGA